MILTMMALALGLDAFEISSSSAALGTTGLLVSSLAQSGMSTGQTNRFQYDALGRIVEVTIEVQDAIQTRVTYAYDAAGNRTQQTTAGSVPHPAARKLVVVLPLGGFTVIPIRTNPSGTSPPTTAVDITPDPFSLGVPVGGATAGAWFASNAPTITGINTGSPVSISGGQYRIDGGAWSMSSGTVSAGQTVQVQVQAASTGGANQTATLTVGGASATFSVTTAVPSEAAPPDYTPDSLNWADLAVGFRAPPSGQPTPPQFADGGALTINGLDSGLSITLRFDQDMVVAGGAGLIVIVYKNGVALNPLSLSIADSANSSRGPAGLTVSVTNGDTISFRMVVFDSTIARNSGNASTKGARQLIYNQTTNVLIDTFNIYGTYQEPTYCGQQEC